MILLNNNYDPSNNNYDPFNRFGDKSSPGSPYKSPRAGGKKNKSKKK